MEKFKTLKTEEELRNDQAEKVVGFLDKIKAFAYVKSILNGREEVEKPDFKKFEDFLVRLNGIARNIPIHERAIDGDKVHLGGFVESIEVPHANDKESLLQYAYEKSRTIDTDDLKYLLPSVINAVHLFADGNGRTSRIVHLLLTDYPSKEEFDAELRNALGEFGRFDSFDINPGLIGYEIQQEVLKNHGWIYSEENPQGTLGPIKTGMASIEIRGLDKENPSYEVARKLLDLASDNGRYVLTAIYMETGGEIQNLMSEYGEEKTLLVSPKKMLEILSHEQWERMLDNFYQLKKEQVETLVDVFVDPEQYQVSDDGETLRDLFIKEIKEQKERNA